MFQRSQESFQRPKDNYVSKYYVCVFYCCYYEGTVIYKVV